MGPRLAVLGAVNRDYLARSDRPLQRAESNPGRLSKSLGGVALNLARTLARLGAEVDFYTVLGCDAEAQALRRELEAEPFATLYAPELPGATASYLALHDDTGEMSLAISDMRLYDNLRPADFLARADFPLARLQAAAAWICEANLNEACLTALTELAVGQALYADPVSEAKAGRLRSCLGRLSLLKPNRQEAWALTGRPGRPEGLPTAVELKALLETFWDMGLQEVLLSLGADGLVLARPGELLHSRPVLPVSGTLPGLVTGAGDTALAALILARLQGAGRKVQLQAAMAAAARCVRGEAALAGELTVESWLTEAAGVAVWPEFQEKR